MIVSYPNTFSCSLFSIDEIFMFIAVQVGFLQPVYLVNESDGRISICIILSRETEREVTVEIFRIGGTGIYMYS